MSDILSQLITLPVRIGLGITFVILIILYLNRDARERDTSPVVWTVIAVIPVAGLVAYCLMRPPMTRRDASEQDMELKLLHNQLKEYGSCPHCGYPTQKDFIICPHCRKGGVSILHDARPRRVFEQALWLGAFAWQPCG